MADITSCFKSVIKDVKLRKKVEGETFSNDKSLLQMKKKTQFSIKAKDVMQHIAKLEEFLLSHRKDYINTAGILGRNSSKMTDSERDQIDADAETFMKTCHEAIRALRTETMREKASNQLGEHRGAVLDSLAACLKEVCKTYSTQRAIRVKRVVDRKKISRLERDLTKPKTFVSQLESRKGPEGVDSTNKDNDTEKKRECRAAGKRVPMLFAEDEDFSPEEAAELAQENSQLYHEMNSIVDEVKQIEGKVVEISRLQEFFAEKVIEQEMDIDRIGDTVVGSVENIKEANDEIREAMRNNAGLRVWILFFLIVLSLTLLFLDWYNP